MALSDGVLVERMRAGDTDAADALLRRYADQAQRVALSVTRSRPIAEEACQEAFLQFYFQRHRIRTHEGAARQFLMLLVHRRAVDAVRHEARQLSSGWANPDCPDIADVVIAIDAARDVRAAAEKLEEPFRTAIGLAYFDGYSYRQVARLMGVPEGTAKSWMRAAIGRLRQVVAV